jgi:exonuclease SbcD
MKGSFRFIHCADLHLGSEFFKVTAGSEELGKRMKNSTFKALDAIVSKARKEKVDFVVFSGDIFDDDCETPLTRSMFVDALEKISVPCYIAYGNHDYKRRWEGSIPYPDNAHVFPDRAECLCFPSDSEPVAKIFGISYSTKHIEKDLTSGMNGDQDCFSIGVLHCDVDSADGGKYAPCRLTTLKTKDIDYWALGHIHKRQVISEYPHVVYPGDTQGLDPTETGEKGAYIVTVTNGRLSAMDFFRTGPILWTDVSADITGKSDMKEVLKDLSAGVEKGSILNVTVKGNGDLDRMIRLDTYGFIDLIESRTGCTVSGLTMRSTPSIDLAKRKETGDFISAVIDFGTKLSTGRREDLLDVICSTTTAESLRQKYDTMSDDELRAIANDAMLLVVEKLTEAGSK